MAAQYQGQHALQAVASEDPNVAVRATDIVKNYGSGETFVHALRDVSVSFQRGAFASIMGPSGSGKSTLMHVLAGIDSVTSGHILLDGTDITRLNDNELTVLRRTKIGFVFQSFNLLPMFTAEQNILMPLTLAGKRPDQQWLDELITSLGLSERLHHLPSQLSGGQQQRVAIARALISKPSIVFADEPTGNLDAVSSAEVLTLMRKMVDDYHQTIVMVTHDATAASYTDRAIILADGRIVADQPHPQAQEMGDMLTRIMQDIVRRKSGDQVPSTSAPISE
jgi:putative ABC transport system ATP-binding protein